MKGKLYKAISLVIILSSFIITASIPFQSVLMDSPPGGDPECVPLDVIFLVDQSDSMSGQRVRDDGELYRFSDYPNDPNDWRENGPEAMVDLLSDFALKNTSILGKLSRLIFINSASGCSPIKLTFLLPLLCWSI